MTQSVQRECWCGSRSAQVVGRIHRGDHGERGDKAIQLPLRDLRVLRGESDGDLSLVRCDGCGVFALFPQPSDAQLLEAYSAEYYGSSRRKFIGPVAAMVAWFQGGRARLAARHTLVGGVGGRVLDVGCGNGGFLMQMKQRGFVVEGTEWTADSAARVPPPTQAGIPVHVGDLLSLDLPANAYDLITMWHVLEHVRDPHAVLGRINTLLKPGGSVILSLPNAESPQARRFGTAWFHHDPPRHLFGFGRGSLSRLLVQLGYHIESINTFSLEQNPFGFIQSWLNERGGAGYSRDRLYGVLKGLSRDRFSTKAADLLWLALLAVPALVISTIESLRGEGATMTIHARKLPP